MMALFTYIPIQNVLSNQPALLNTVIGCNKGYVIHRAGSGIVTLRGIVNNPCDCRARYNIIYNGNIAVPEGATAGPIALVITLSGEPLLDTVGIVTPADVDNYFCVSGQTTIDVPRGLGVDIAIEKFIPSVAATATSITSINVSNLSLRVDRAA